MRIKPKNLIQHELIGLKVEVLNSPNPSEIGLNGTVVDEYKNILVLDVKGERKKILKKDRTFLFILPDNTKVRVEGRKIQGRPEERLKRRIKRW